MRKIISLICLLLPIVASADSLEIRENAPERHVVVKGDTLWDISAKFFKSPWKWQEIWGLNKDTITNPHWIYPGDVILLDRKTGTLQINATQSSAPQQVNQTLNGNIVKLSPQVREIVSEHNQIPVIPFSEIAPFLSKPLVAETTDLANLPILEGTYEQRELLGVGDIAYVRNLPADKGLNWQAYRMGKPLIDPDTKQLLGNEIIYLGDTVVEKFATLSQVRITQSVMEMSKGDHFRQASEPAPSHFQPHAPTTQIAAKIISIYSGATHAGRNAVITLNKGSADGLENGHVLALYQKGEVVIGGRPFKRTRVDLPDMRYGLVVVFRTFNKVSYGLIIQSQQSAELFDSAVTP
jgi:hypothetical protein